MNFPKCCEEYYFGILTGCIELKLSFYLNILDINISQDQMTDQSKKKNLFVANFYRGDVRIDHPTNLGQDKRE